MEMSLPGKYRANKYRANDDESLQQNFSGVTPENQFVRGGIPLALFARAIGFLPRPTQHFVARQ